MRFLGWFRRKETKREGQSSVWSVRQQPDASDYILEEGYEVGRLDLQHVMLQLAAGKNYRAPLREPRTILDVACGTGTWGRQMAAEFKRAQVVGFDVNVEQVRTVEERLARIDRLPSNFQFLQANALQPFPFETATFDFTHGRLLAPFLPRERWPEVIAEMLRVTKPGGYIELVDFESHGALSTSQALMRLWELSAKAFEQRGLYPGAGAALAGLLRQGGLQRVQERQFLIGEGRQATRQQRLQKANTLAGLSDLGKFLTQVVKLLPQEEFDYLLDRAKAELADPQARIVTPFNFAFGMKPLS